MDCSFWFSAAAARPGICSRVAVVRRLTMATDKRGGTGPEALVTDKTTT